MVKTSDKAANSVKINDVAKLAGVSITTVSRVMNGSSKVSRKTMKKVQKVIEDVGYVPNEMARGLVTKNNKIIGVLIPDIINGYYAEIITIIEPLLSAKGYSMQLCITSGRQDKLSYYLEDLIRRRAAGVIILSSSVKDETLIERVKDSMAVVSIEGNIKGINRICVDGEQGTYDAVENLILNGHRCIAFVGYHLEEKGLLERKEGYLKAHQKYEIPINQAYIIDDQDHKNPGYNAMMKLLSLPKPPTAVQCMNEYCAHGVYLALMERGIKIPDEMSVSAFDGQENMKILNPRLTTAVIPMKDMAEAAVDMILQTITGGKSQAQLTMQFPVKLRKGKSVKNVLEEAMQQMELDSKNE